jgi:GT2 family glycosyltransferase
VQNWTSNNQTNIKSLSNPSKLSSAARNIGVKAANGEFVLFLDGHIFIPNNNLLLSMGGCARRQNAKVLARPQPLTPPSISFFQKVVAEVRNLKIAHSRSSYIYSDYSGWVDPLSVSVMYHHSLFDEIGYFDESFDAAEDIEFNFRLKKTGYQAFISPDFSVLYYPRKGLISLFRQMFRYGFGRQKFMRKHPQGFDCEILIPVFALITLISFMLFVPIDYILGFLLLGYITTIFIFLIALPKKTHATIAPFVLLSIYSGLSCGIIASSLTRTTQTRHQI